MKILFVDDEKWTLEYLERAVDWNALGLTVAGRACNGREAIPLILEEKPEIAVVDIRMPVMDGLALMEWIRENGADTKVVILSAYGEFEYARKALSLGAAGYLLKPLDEIKMIEEIRKVTGRIERERNRQNKLVRMQNQLKENRQIVRERLFTRLLDPGADIPAVLKELKETGMDTDRPGWFLMIVRQSGSLPDSLIAQALSDFTDRSGYLMRRTGTEELVILIGSGEAAGQNAAERLLNSLSPDADRMPFIALSRSLRNLNNLSEIYRTLQELIRYRFYYTGGQIISPGDIPLPAAGDSAADFRHTDLLLEYLGKGMEQESLDLLDEFFDGITSKGYREPEAVYDYCYRHIIRIGQTGRKARLDSLTLQNLREFETLKSLKSFMAGLIAETAASNRTGKDDSGRLIEKVRQFMNTNFSSPIGLEDIAGAVGLSRNYLCCLYKKETGTNVWDYLTSRRMEEAKRLLHETNDKTYEVALKVGYDNPGYFSRMFRKYVGTTPREYRSRL